MKDEVNTQIKFFYFYWALVGTWFAAGVSLFFNRQYLNIGYLGIIDAVVLAVCLIAEIPSGAFADKFGRRKTVILGVLLGGLGTTIWGFATAGWMIVFGNILFALGTACQSGADNAMMYDYLKAKGKEDLWAKINVNTTIIARLSYVFSLFIGGVAYTYFERAPFLLRALTFFLMLIPLYKLSIVDGFQHMHKDNNEVQGYWHNLKTGVMELFKVKVVWMAPIYLLVQGIAYGVFGAGILRPLLYEHSGLPIKYISAALSVAIALTVITLFVFKKYESKLFKPVTIFILSILCVIGFSVNLGTSMIVSLIGLTLLQVSSFVLFPVMNNEINKHIDSRHRATTLSAASFMENIVYVIAAPIVGYMAGVGMLNEIVIGCMAVVLIGLLASIFLYKVHYRNT